jgi:hypothetical protein
MKKAKLSEEKAAEGRRTLPHAGLAHIARPPQSCQGGRRYRQNDHKCKGSAKEGDHEVKKTGNDNESLLWVAGCGWNLNSCHKYLIFRGLEIFCRIFHPFFTPYFSFMLLNSGKLCKTHAHKRHAIVDFGVRIADLRDTNCTNAHKLAVIRCPKKTEAREDLLGPGRDGRLNFFAGGVCDEMDVA